MSRSSAVSFIVTSTDSSRRTAQPKTLFCPTLKTGKSPHGRSSYASGNASAVSFIRRSIVLSRTAPFWRFRGRLGREPAYDSKTRKRSFHGEERQSRDDSESVHHRRRPDGLVRGEDDERRGRRARACRRGPAPRRHADRP